MGDVRSAPPIPGVELRASANLAALVLAAVVVGLVVRQQIRPRPELDELDEQLVKELAEKHGPSAMNLPSPKGP